MGRPLTAPKTNIKIKGEKEMKKEKKNVKIDGETGKEIKQHDGFYMEYEQDE